MVPAKRANGRCAALWRSALVAVMIVPAMLTGCTTLENGAGPDEQEARLLAQPLRTITMEFDMAKPILAALAALLVLAGPLTSAPAYAGDCTGYVVGVRPPSAYNQATGSGLLAVRTGPGSNYRKIGELYAGDEVSAYDRRGNWYAVTCMQGQCMRPFWGQPMPSGWAHGSYLRLGGVCP